MKRLIYTMFARKLGASMVLEIWIVLAILVMLTPTILNTLRQVLNQQNQWIYFLQHKVERLDIYHYFLTDARVITSDVGDNCFQSDTHDICYEIKDQVLRRKKKKLSSTRYYIHTIGKHKVMDQLQMAYASNQLHVAFTRDSVEYEWVFWSE